MPNLTVYVFDRENKKAWRIRPSAKWFAKHDNGHMVSVGMELWKDITQRQLNALRPREVDYDKAQHAGCQSECIRRGGQKCRW